MPSFYRQSIQNAVNQQINIGKSKHRTTLNREAIGQVVSYCAVAAAHDLWDWGEKESTLLTLKMNNAASRYILDHDKYGAPEAKKRLETDGRNRTEQREGKKGFWRRFLAQFNDFMILLLIGAAVASVAISYWLSLIHI